MRLNGTRDICNEATIAQKGTTMKSTLMQTSDILGRPVGADIGWPHLPRITRPHTIEFSRPRHFTGTASHSPFAKRRHR